MAIRAGRLERAVRLVALAVAMCASASRAAAAQQKGAIAGTVADSAGMPIVGAQIVVEGAGIYAVSDAQGHFRLGQVPTGSVVVRLRRLGYRPARVEAEVAPALTASVNVGLTALAATLAPVVVNTERVDYTGRLAGFYQRLERREGGYFITRDLIERENPRMMTHLLQRVPSVTLVRARGGITGVRMRGRTCWPLVWLDGLPMPTGEVDLDSFSPHSLEGIELYLGSTSPPSKYIHHRNMSSCGTILLWSRSTDAEWKRNAPATTMELEALVSSHGIFTADQVDTTAHLALVRPLDVAYPPSLFAAGTRGLVVAEFVVDTVGHVELDTFGVVSSTHPLFTQAVRDALADAIYVPAVRLGRAVRQLVHQPFDFVLPTRRSER